jgi:hypothetical protein
MSTPTQPRQAVVETADVDERIAQHLLRKPYDLVDSRRLLRLFKASAEDFQRALQRMERMPRDQSC